jgi:ABC-2 type transport system permease protein
MRKLWQVAKHEFKTTAANKAFVVITILGPFLILAITLLPGLLASKPNLLGSGGVVAVLGADDVLMRGFEASLSAKGWKAAAATDELDARDGVLSGRLAGAVIVPKDWKSAAAVRFLSKNGTDIALYGVIEQAYGSMVTEARLADSGIDRALLAEAMKKPAIEIEKVKASGKNEKTEMADFLGLYFTALTFVMFIYMTVLLYGQMIGRSVVAEKTSKTVEIMLSSLSARELMFGKILGMGLAGILQYATWGALSVLLIKVIGPAFHLSLPASVTLQNVGALIVFFVLGFMMYSTCYAAIGAAAEDEQNMGQLAMPLLILIAAPMVLGISSMSRLDSPMIKALSWFPLSAPTIMLMRIVMSPPPLWEILGSILLMIATIFLLILGAAKIFRVGILMTGKRLKLPEVLKWLGKK